MNILVLGNGFDLAHGLPTKYHHFLEFCKCVFPIYKNTEDRGIHLYQLEYLSEWNFNKDIKEKLRIAYESKRKITTEKNIIHIKTDYPRLDEIYESIRYNIWIKYFLQCNMYQKENWIDFENEISSLIQSLNNDMREANNNIEAVVHNLSNEFLKKIYSDYIDAVHPINSLTNDWGEGVSFKVIRNKLLDDLNRLIRAFEIYLTEYVEKIDIKIISPDIKEIAAVLCEEQGIKGILFSKVISFNYTNMYEKIYLDKFKNSDYIDYIHGKADIINTVDTNNMVLGIDEFLSNKRKNKDTNFIAFKKFYQRIYKGTGQKYKEWIEVIKKDTEDYQIELEKAKLEKNSMLLKSKVRGLQKEYFNEHKLYIFGHSLDITDKDILRDLILNDNVYTTIFYPDKDELGKKIANLVKVIGQDELIRRTGGSTKTIEFKMQRPMEEADII